jgi:hypothetical protein
MGLVYTPQMMTLISVRSGTVVEIRADKPKHFRKSFHNATFILTNLICHELGIIPDRQDMKLMTNHLN